MTHLDGTESSPGGEVMRITARTTMVGNGLEKSFGGVRALRGVDITLPPGKVTGLVGENGAGKSTLIGVLTGAHQANHGTIAIDDRVQGSWNVSRAWSCGVVAIRQEPMLVPTMSVAENLSLGREPSRLGVVRRAAISAHASSCLHRLDSHIDSTVLAGDLSPAKRQLVEIARAVGAGARVLFLDEPTAALGPSETERLFEIIRGLAKSGVAIAYVSHRIPELLDICDQFTVLRDGSKVSEGSSSDYTAESLVRAMAGREVSSVERANRSGSTEPPVFTLSAVSVPGRLHDVNLEIRPGEVHGLFGIVGAGRTTLTQTMAGIVAGTGDLNLRGRPYRPKSVEEANELGVVYLPEDRHRNGLFPGLGQAANITMPRLRRIARLGVVNDRTIAERARPWCERLDVRPIAPGMPVEHLSGGNQQKVLLARALHSEPSLLLLDEPTRGVDVGAKRDIHMEIEKLAADGVAVVMSSSDLAELVAVCDRITVLYAGRIVNSVECPFSSELLLAAAVGQLDDEPQRPTPRQETK